MSYGDGPYGGGLYGHQLRTPAAGSLLDRFVGAESVVVTIAGHVSPLGKTGAISIRHGRATPDQQPEAGTCTLTIASDALPALPAYGDPLTVELGDDAAGWLGLVGADLDAARWRFTGEVTDVLAAPRSALTGPAVVTIVAVTRRARLGRTYIGDTPWPAELDGARAQRILDLVAAAGGPGVGTVDAGTVTVLARDVDRRSARELLEGLSVGSGGVVAESRAGLLSWHDGQHRDAVDPVVVLDASEVLAPAVATQNLAGVVNDLVVTYGAEPQASLRVVDDASVALYGQIAPPPIVTQLATADDAGSYARRTIGRRSRPRWSTPALPVDLLRGVAPATAGQLLQLEFGDLLGVSGFPATGPFAAANLWLEGWTEQISRHAWRLSLDASDYRLTGPALRWSDVDPATQWQDLPPDLTWLDAQFALT